MTHRRVTWRAWVLCRTQCVRSGGAVFNELNDILAYNILWLYRCLGVFASDSTYPMLWRHPIHTTSHRRSCCDAAKIACTYSWYGSFVPFLLATSTCEELFWADRLSVSIEQVFPSLSVTHCLSISFHMRVVCSTPFCSPDILNTIAWFADTVRAAVCFPGQISAVLLGIVLNILQTNMLAVKKKRILVSC